MLDRKRVFRTTIFMGIFVAIMGGAIGMGVMMRAQAQDQDSKARRDFMRVKMMYSSNILEGLTNKDFKLIEEGANEIIGVTAAEKWLAVDTMEYRRHSDELKTAAEKLKKEAKKQNLEGAALRFFDMTLKCIDCHEHIRELSF